MKIFIIEEGKSFPIINLEIEDDINFMNSNYLHIPTLVNLKRFSFWINQSNEYIYPSFPRSDSIMKVIWIYH